MALMTDDIQQKIITLFQEEGLVSADALQQATEASAKENKSLLTLLTETKVIDDELMTHAIAHVSGVPYVNLMNTLVDQSISFALAA